MCRCLYFIEFCSQVPRSLFWFVCVCLRVSVCLLHVFVFVRVSVHWFMYVCLNVFFSLSLCALGMRCCRNRRA